MVGKLIRIRMHYGYHCAGGRWCSGRTCAACRDGYKAELRTLWRLEDEAQSHYLWESRPRLDSLVSEVVQQQQRGYSADVEIWREREAKNAPICARILRVFSYPDLYDLRALADSAYKPPMRIAEPASLEPARPGGLLDGLQDTRVSGVEVSKLREEPESGRRDAIRARIRKLSERGRLVQEGGDWERATRADVRRRD